MQEGLVNFGAAKESWQQIVLADDVVDRYGLEVWAQAFSLMTAGYRDRLDPNDPDNPDVPFNRLTVAILAEAKARVFERSLREGELASVHLGGEVRPHTQSFIQVAARVYAAHGFRVHLRKGLRTTPIWYSSFGVFHEGLQSGDNFTASHSQFYKGGWKPLDSEGKQLLAEESEIIAEVRAIVRSRMTIRLAPSTSDLIRHDFDVDEAYRRYLCSVVGEGEIEQIRRAGSRGFRCTVCTLGGSMKATSERLLTALEISTGESGTIDYVLGEEDPEYHRMGHLEGDILGVDPTSPRIYRSVGAQQRLLAGTSNLFLIWDPDGDRVSVVTIAPSSVAAAARRIGLKVDLHADSASCIVYFTSNQLYLMLVAFRLESLRIAGLLDRYNWFVCETYPTSKSIEELARCEGLPVVRVPVGFKHIGDFCRCVEDQLDVGGVRFEMATGETISLGDRPRALILCEESGGATLGSHEMLHSRYGQRKLLALREKDGLQVGLLAIALGSRLFDQGSSFAAYYCDIISRYKITYTHFLRRDIKLYDEGLMGEQLKQAKAKGLRIRDRKMSFFQQLAEDQSSGRSSLEDVQRALNQRMQDGAEPIPALRRVCPTGEGILFETEDSWFMIRASGTDAVMRYYIEGTEGDAVAALATTLTTMLPAACSRTTLSCHERSG